MISKAYVEKFGPTPGCAMCRAILNHDYSSSTLGHDQTCHERMEDLLARDPLLSKQLEKARLREDEYLARQVEAGDTRAKRSRSENPPRTWSSSQAQGVRRTRVVLDPKQMTRWMANR